MSMVQNQGLENLIDVFSISFIMNSRYHKHFKQSIISATVDELCLCIFLDKTNHINSNSKFISGRSIERD